MPLQSTSGAASYDAFGGGVAVLPKYIEDYFSAFLYTGNGSTQTINNGIDLSTKGGLVWGKNRDGNWSHYLADTARGTGKFLESNTTSANTLDSTSLTAFNANGFSIGNAGAFINNNGVNYVSWTWAKAPKFFDVVTWTGSGANTTIAHNLGSVPGSIFVKRTDTTAAWAVYHRSLANTEYLVLNTTAAKATGATYWNSTTPTSTVFSLGTDASVNASGGTYVAYLFAHNAGGFGLTGTDNVISCGSYTGVGSTQQEITLGYEPQWVMIKRTDTADSWIMVDNMRGFFRTADNALEANSSNAEATGVSVSGAMQPTATGFRLFNGNSAVNATGGTYIYIAIRRGPMKVPTSGTSVFTPIARTGTGAPATVTGVGFPTDLVFHRARLDNVISPANLWQDRLRGIQQFVNSSNTNIEYSDPDAILTLTMDGMTVGSDTNEGNVNYSGVGYINYFMRRAPSFFDEVCYTGTGSATTFAHNLGVVPELMIVKRRSSAEDWLTYSSATGNTKYLYINGTATAQVDSRMWNDTTPTSSVFTVGTYGGVNSSGGTFVAYLFATCAGVSKVGSYTGTATTKQVDCGFTGGARWVMIKRTDSTGDWYVWDSARGIVSGNDPYLFLNSTAAEVTNTDYVDTYSAGFEISSTAPAAINANGGSFIFLAIA